ncbi:retrovirus-related pol polyprotein from transposon TNT 1-94 [Tanacetum coccineum]
MAAVEVPQTLEYRGGQLNAASVLEVENFTNWKKRFMCHIIAAKSTWDDVILYHEVPSDVKESRVMDLKLYYNTFKFKEVSSDDNEMVEVKVLMALAEDNDAVSKEGARNGEWVKISIRKYDIRKPIWYLDSGCSRHMTGVKSYLHKYMEQLGPKVVFGDDSTCTIEGYGSIKCNGIFDKKRGTIFNSNKEVVMIAPRVRDVYALDMTSSAQESCFFAKASENLNWIWQKRLAHLNFKTINKLAKQNLISGLPSLIYSKDKPCSLCEKGKHHRASFKTKQTSSIKKCLHLLHMDLFRHVTPRSNNHEKYTLVIVDEYSRNNILVNFFYIHYHKDHLGKFDEKADDGFLLGYLLVSKIDEILNDNLFEHSNHNNDEQIIDNLSNTKDIQISEHSSYPNVKDTLVQDTISIPNPPLPIPSVVTTAPQDRWS